MEGVPKAPYATEETGPCRLCSGHDTARPEEGFKSDSIYVIARGLVTIAQKYNEATKAAGSEQFLADFESLKGLMEHADTSMLLRKQLVSPQNTPVTMSSYDLTITTL